MSWESAQSHWYAFLTKIEEARCQLHCSYSNAWFRGMEDSSWDLTTSLFRYENRIDADTRKIISRTKSNLNEVEQNLVRQVEKKATLQARLDESKDERGSKLYQATARDYRYVRDQIASSKGESRDLRQRLAVLEAIHYGERESFTEFSFRVGHSTICSWEILAEMQHYKAPTRLLDWSEVLAISVFFALKSYIRELNKSWELEIGKGIQHSAKNKGRLRFVVPEGLPTPRIWILNPYRLSRLARGENALLDPTKDRRHDYFDSFFINHSWPFRLPVPVYIPWKNPRITAQRAMFTVQGLDIKPLNRLLNDSDEILRAIDISAEAAVYGVRHLMNFIGLNSFSIFQDLDSLGDEIKKHFIIPN